MTPLDLFRLSGVLNVEVKNYFHRIFTFISLNIRRESSKY